MGKKWISVTGSRTYPVYREQYDLLEPTEKLDALDKGMKLTKFLLSKFPPDEFGIVTGGAKGVDTWAEQAADEYGLECVVYPAEWDKYGKSAGVKRNKLILHHANHGSMVLWDGVSSGTKHFLTICFKARQNTWLIGPSGTPWAQWDEDFWAAHPPESKPKMDIPKGG